MSTMTSTRDDRAGLRWVATSDGPQPRWDKSLNIHSIEVLVRQHLHLPPQAICTVTPLGEGRFNKVYSVVTNAKTYVIRFALPFDPVRKTSSEVATMRFVRDNVHTGISIPAVEAYENTSQNIVGFEWIVMDCVPGKTLGKAMESIDWPRLKAIMEALAKFQARLFDIRFSGIGSLHHSLGRLRRDEDALSNQLGPMVATTLFWGQRGQRDDFSCGPYRNSFEWMSTRLQIVEDEQSAALAHVTDNASRKAAQNILDLVARLRGIQARALDTNPG